MTVPSGAEVRPGLAAAVLRYLEEHPHAVDTARGIATYYGTRLYGKRLERG
jgi:hypothetical protein